MLKGIFDEDDYEAAKALMQSRSRGSLGRAIEFRNSLHALLRDVERGQTQHPPKKIIAIDTGDIVSLFRYQRPQFSAFTFGEFILGSSPTESDRANYFYLDVLILSYLVRDRNTPFILLDPYAEELSILRLALGEKQRRTEDHFSMLFERELPRFEGFQRENIEKIQKYILSKGEKEFEEEWDTFLNTFLPNMRRETIDSIRKSDLAMRSFDDFIEHGKYRYIRPKSHGDRSFLHDLVGDDFLWNEFDTYCKKDDVRENYKSIVQIISKLWATARDEAPTDSAVRDGRAFADIHTLNSFFHDAGLNYRVELVSRAASLHSVLSVLPEGRLKLNLRHPLLVPDLYQFGPEALATIGDVLTRVEGLLRPHMDEPDHNAARRSRREALKIASDASRSIEPFFRDVLFIEQIKESEKDKFIDIYRRSNFHPGSPFSEDAVGEAASSIYKIFELIIRQLDKKDDPLSRRAYREIFSKNRALIDYEGKYTFAKNATLNLRVAPISSRTISPIDFLAVRPTGTRYNRIVHIYCERIKSKLLPNYMSIDDELLDENSVSPLELDFSISNILDTVQSALNEISGEVHSGGNQSFHQGGAEKSSRDTVLYNIEATTLACVAFASRGRYDIAVSISSAVLHEAMSSLRQADWNFSTYRPPLSHILAYRELFLLRCHCERGAALDEFFSVDRRLGASRGVVGKNFARAQRDLDFAAWLSEFSYDKESASVEPDNSRKAALAPAGVFQVDDFRLQLTDMAGWMDQFLVLSAGDNRRGTSGSVSDGVSALQTRMLAWTAVGSAKAATVHAYQARLQAECAAGDIRAIRYLNHAEARGLQNALVMFLLVIGSEVIPDSHIFWDVKRRSAPERVLAFRSWRDWWSRYADLQSKWQFEMRLFPLIKAVCGRMAELDDMKTIEPSTEKTATAQKVIKKIIEDLRSIHERNEKNEVFKRGLGELLIRRAEQFIEN